MGESENISQRLQKLSFYNQSYHISLRNKLERFLDTTSFGQKAIHRTPFSWQVKVKTPELVMLPSIERMGAMLAEGMGAIDIRPTDFWPNDVLGFFMPTIPSLVFYYVVKLSDYPKAL